MIILRGCYYQIVNNQGLQLSFNCFFHQKGSFFKYPLFLTHSPMFVFFVQGPTFQLLGFSKLKTARKMKVQPFLPKGFEHWNPQSKFVSHFCSKSECFFVFRRGFLSVQPSFVHHQSFDPLPWHLCVSSQKGEVVRTKSLSSFTIALADGRARCVCLACWKRFVLYWVVVFFGTNTFNFQSQPFSKEVAWIYEMKIATGRLITQGNLKARQPGVQCLNEKWCPKCQVLRLCVSWDILRWDSTWGLQCHIASTMFSQPGCLEAAA